MRMVFSLLIVAFLVSCSASNNERVNNKKTPREPRTAPVVTPDVKYPAAIVFEIGVVNADKVRIPHKRIYVCLEESETKLEGEYLFDLTELSEEPFYQRALVNGVWENIAQLKTIMMSYTYRGILSESYRSPEGDLYAYGEAVFESTTDQEWESFPSDTYNNHKTSVFDLDVSGAMMFRKEHRLSGGKVYMSSTAQTYYFDYDADSKEISQNIIDVCEEADKQVVILSKDQIK